jgi:hypothetical protein
MLKYKMDNTNVIIFNSITSFVSDLNTEFGSRYKNIKLYNRLLEKTGIVNVEPVLKHIESFRRFFNQNRQGMEEKNINLFTEDKISYNDRVYIDIKNVLGQSTKETSKIIWKHLLVIWNLIDPTSHAKKILKESMVDSKEGDFLNNIIEKVESAVGNKDLDTSNPMAAVSSLMSSGVFTDLISGMQTGLQSGNLDIGKLMSGLTGMITKLSNNGGGSDSMPPEFAGMMNMMAGMGNMMNTSSASTSSSKHHKKSKKSKPSSSVEVIEEQSIDELTSPPQDVVTQEQIKDE